MNNSTETKKDNLRKSKNREYVISLFQKAKNPLSVEDIYNVFLKRKKKIALSTIYRIIEKLLALNIIHESVKDGEKSLYEIIDNAHKHYLICTKCRKMISLDLCPFGNFEENIVEETGYKITGHKFEIFGICPSCQ